MIYNGTTHVPYKVGTYDTNATSVDGFGIVRTTLTTGVSGREYDTVTGSFDIVKGTYTTTSTNNEFGYLESQVTDGQSYSYLLDESSYVSSIYTTTAEYIFHATLNQEGTDIEECIFYSLIPFKSDVWKSEFNKYKIFWLPTKFDNGNFQLTLNRLIPKDIIKSNALEFWEWNK